MSKNIGELTELKFYLEAFELGFIASKPFGDNAKYDFIIDSDGILSRVQVKSTNIKDERIRGDAYRINSSYGATRKNGYTKKEIDFLAAYIIPENTWYIIPIDKISGIKSLYFSPQKKCKKRLEIFKERWDLFKQSCLQPDFLQKI